MYIYLSTRIYICICIFFILCVNYVHKDKTIIKLGLSAAVHTYIFIYIYIEVRTSRWVVLKWLLKIFSSLSKKYTAQEI